MKASTLSMSDPGPPPTPTTVASICPGCGHPRLLSGNASRVRCPSCGQEHAVEPELARAAEAYRLARANLPLQMAQSEDIDAISASSNLVAHRYRIAAGVLAGPLVLLAVLGLVLRSLPREDTHPGRTFFTATYELPLLVLVATGLGALVLLRRRRASIQRLLWARSLEDAPGVLACRMCGGPLAAHAETSAVVSCRFCHADNMVGPEVSAAAAKLAVADYAAHASSVLDGTTKRATTFLTRAALVLPLLTLVIALVAQESAFGHARGEHLPVDATTAYQLVHCGAEEATCAHHATEDLHESCGREAMVVSTAHAPELVGRAVQTRDIAWETRVDFPETLENLHVTEVYRDGLGRNHVEVAAKFDVRGNGLVEGVCLKTAADGGTPR